MEPTFQLTPESARALAMRLFTKEQFAANPRACIIGALDWLDQAAGDPKPGESAALVKPPRDRRIERLDSNVKMQGAEAVATQIGVSVNAIRAWQHGAQPNPGSYAKIEKFLNSEAPIDTAGAEHQPRESGELFGQQQLEPKTSTADKQPGPTKD